MKAPFKMLETANVLLDKNKLALKHRSTQFIVSLVRHLFLIGMSFVMVYPVLYILSAAFKAMRDVYNPTVVWIPKNFSWDSLKYALQLLDIAYMNEEGKLVFKTLAENNTFLNSAMLTVPCVLLQLATCLLAGYGFAHFKFRGKNVLFAVLIFTIIVPVQTYMIPLYASFSNFDYFGIGSLIGLFTGEPLVMSALKTRLPFYLMAGLGAGIRSGLYIFMLRQFFAGMPKELDEAASIDGCGPVQTFVRVMLPNAIPMMITIMVFSLVWYWNDYYLSSMFFGNSPTLSSKLTSVVELSGMAAGLDGIITPGEFEILKEGIFACGCLIIVLPPLLLYIIAQRYFTEGLERSGIVG